MLGRQLAKDIFEDRVSRGHIDVDEIRGRESYIPVFTNYVHIPAGVLEEGSERSDGGDTEGMFALRIRRYSGESTRVERLVET